jgi:COMPASS component SWD2
VFTICTAGSIRLFDLRNYEKGPFSQIPVNIDPEEKWTGVKFSNNGRDLLITTRQEKIYVADTFEYRLKHILSGFENKTGITLEASFTPDGEYILSGSQDGSIHSWRVSDGSPVYTFAGHSSPTSVVKFNPKYLMMATGCVNLAFWIPAFDWARNDIKFPK